METKKRILPDKPIEWPSEDERRVYKNRKDIISLSIIWWLIAAMFYIDILVNVIGISSGNLEVQPIAISFGVILAIVFTMLAILEMRKLKR